MSVQSTMIRLSLAAVLAGSASVSFGAIIRNTAGGTESSAGTVGLNSSLFGDAEVREEAVKYNQTSNLTRGNSSELATRRAASGVNSSTGAESGGNNSVMMMRFDLTGITAAQVSSQPTTLRLTINTTSWTAARSNSMPTTPLDPMALQYGLQYYALKPSSANQNWDESTIRFDTAPGLNYDAGTPNNPLGGLGEAPVGFNSQVTPLGMVNFPIPASGNLQVGTPFDLTNVLLRNAILANVNAGVNTLTILAAVYDTNTIGYNYIFASNDTTQLLTQPGNPLSAAPNTGGQFSPRLYIGPVPEPTSFAALALGGLFLRRRRA